ncbi:uncharacterized protein LOC122504601 [Leptopilina heterotoma]|uniref:uncharacterized protein LOC122504601 n=1 Tax=Leptopilina heterotoma TaxID=63436 RepID=UPI001CA94200|nr:uncharacterized protein LOC122504601 [Leptopilina heterotoma]
MPRTCCICGCTTSTENRRQLFKFPTDEENRNKWWSAIGNNIKRGRSHRSNLFVCNQHFAESCFQRELIEVLRDGCEVSLPRKCVTLKKDSVPSIFENFGVSKSVTNGESALNNLDSLATCTIKQEPSDELPNIETHIKIENLKPIENDETNLPSNMDSQSARTTYKRALSPTSQTRVNIAKHVMGLQVSTPIRQPVNQPIIQPLNAAKIICLDSHFRPYTKEDLLNDWNSRDLKTFPKYWGLTEIDDGVFFGYVGDVPYKVTRGILVKRDMSVEVRAKNRVAKLPVIENVTSIEILRSAMIQVVCLKLCDMAGREECENRFFLPVPKSKSNKCKDCQVQNRREKHNVNRKEHRFKIKESQAITTNADLKKKLNQATKKIEAMRKYIDNLMTNSLINEELIEESMKDLPQEMQNDIRTNYIGKKLEVNTQVL